MVRRGADAFTDQLDSHRHTVNSRGPGGHNDVSPVPLDPSLAPLLLFDRGGGQADGDDGIIFLYSIPTRKLLSRSRRAAGLAGHRYWVTPQGWLLMLHLESRDTFLWNPSNLERICLHVDEDNLLDGIGRSRCLLSRRPSDADADADCVVLLLDRENRVLYYCVQDQEAADGSSTRMITIASWTVALQRLVKNSARTTPTELSRWSFLPTQRSRHMTCWNIELNPRGIPCGVISS